MAEKLSVDPEQVLRLSGPGPRYTSYPTVPLWTNAVDDAAAHAAFQRAASDAEAPLSIYVHVPFCKRLCLYCACNVKITKDETRVERYLEALEREIETKATLLGARRRATQMHWGGGTPTHLSSAQLRRLHGVLARHFEFRTGAEVSIEVHPHVTTNEQLDTLVDLGFSRISLGVQDVDTHVQEVVRRDQTVEDTTRTVEHSRSLGVSGVNIDLMYGLPAQTEATFAATLDTIASIRPDRLAIYGYAHVPWLKPAQRALEKQSLPDPQLRAKLFAGAVQRLGTFGYDVIGLDHFALSTDSLAQSLRDGSLHRNFMGYTTERAPDMVAFGTSAIGDVGGAFLQNAQTTDEYEKAIHAGGLATVRGLVRSEDDDLRRAVIQSLMCRMELDLDHLESDTGLAGLQERFAPEWARLQPLVDEGLCRVEPRRIEVLPTGRMFLRHVAMIFDAYLEQKSPGTSRFSQTI